MACESYYYAQDFMETQTLKAVQCFKAAGKTSHFSISLCVVTAEDWEMEIRLAPSESGEEICAQCHPP